MESRERRYMQMIGLSADQSNHSNQPSRQATSNALKRKAVRLRACRGTVFAESTSSGPSRGQGNSKHSFPRGGREGVPSSAKGKIIRERAWGARRLS